MISLNRTFKSLLVDPQNLQDLRVFSGSEPSVLLAAFQLSTDKFPPENLLDRFQSNVAQLIGSDVFS